MIFESPQVLWLLLALPALAGLYVLLQRRRSRSAVRYASLGLIRTAMGRRARLRRHVPPFIFLFALGALIVAIARPSAVITLPSEQRNIILAIDVSLSMRATDVQPSRIEAAREAAKTFVAEQPSDVRIGIVAFAGSASIVQKPTDDKKELIDAIDRLQLQLHTATGSGIIVSLAALFPEDAAELEAANTSTRGWREPPRSAPIDKPIDATISGRPFREIMVLLSPDSRWPARTTAMACRSPGRRPSRSIGPDTLIAAMTRPVRSRIGADTLATPASRSATLTKSSAASSNGAKRTAWPSKPSTARACSPSPRSSSPDQSGLWAWMGVLPRASLRAARLPRRSGGSWRTPGVKSGDASSERLPWLTNSSAAP